MATYVIGDIHGEYDMFMELLEKIDLKDSDTLYVIGDVLDRGPNPMTTLRKIMEMPNAFCLAGNHEFMALECLGFLSEEITEDSLRRFDSVARDNFISWELGGGGTTADEFAKLLPESQQDVFDYLKDLLIYEELTVAGQDYLLVHGGLGSFSPDKPIEDYSLSELIWMRADYDTQYFDDVIVVTGHTPTQAIPGNPAPGYIFRQKNHIAIDCGACYEGGRLAAICLDTGEEFYSSVNCSVDKG